MSNNVKAVKMEGWDDKVMEYRDDRNWYGPPGAMIPIQTDSKDPFRRYHVACPGCGRISAPVDGASWSITLGVLDDPTTLTVSPSWWHRKDNGGCGWHGHLVKGEFVPC